MARSSLGLYEDKAQSEKTVVSGYYLCSLSYADSPVFDSTVCAVLSVVSDKSRQLAELFLRAIIVHILLLFYGQEPRPWNVAQPRLDRIRFDFK